MYLLALKKVLNNKRWSIEWKDSVTYEQHHIHEYDSFQNKFERNTRSQSEMKNEIKVFTI